MTTQKERADWFKKLYMEYGEKFNIESEIGEVCMAEEDFYDKLMEIVEDEWRSWD